MPYTKSTQKKYGDNPLKKRTGFKMKGFSGFKNEGPVKKDPIVRNYGKPPTGDPTFERGFEESPKIMELLKKGLIPGSKNFGKKQQ